MLTLMPDAQLKSSRRIGSDDAASTVARTTSWTEVNERVCAPVP